MFADSLWDSPWANRSRRGWTTLVSFAFQALAVGSLLLLPLIYTSGLPPLQWAERVIAPAPPPAAPPPEVLARTSSAPLSNVAADGRLVAPPTIPSRIAQFTETAPPPPPDIGAFGVGNSTGDRTTANGVWNSLGNGLNLAQPPPAPVLRPPRVSRMMEGNLIHRVQPDYPTLAKIAHVQGTVVLHAVIGKDGKIKDLHVVSGSPLLVRAAKDAVNQWRYRPYILNGEPIEVDTQVTVSFVLSNPYDARPG
jgi:periplasmic protein TonB